MALAGGRGGGQRFSATIWPGFVDAMTALLMVLMFVLTIFMIVQFSLRETINSQDDELEALSAQVAGLADALGLERDRSASLQSELGGLNADLVASRAAGDRQSALIATLTSQVQGQTERLSQAEARITDFEAQVASLLAERDAARAEAVTLGAERDRLATAEEALNLAVARARAEVDAQAEAARLAAARREALEALVADLRAEGAETAEKLTAAEAAQLTEAAAAAALRARLAGAEDELTAMTLALEAERARAEETLTLLAAAEGARDDLNARLAAALLAEETRAADLAAAMAAREAAETGRAEERAALESRLAMAEAARDASAAERALAETDRAETERRLAEALAARLAAETALAEGAQDRESVQDQLAAALAARLAAEAEAGMRLSEVERQQALLAAADRALADEKAASAEGARRLALLNQQITALRAQLGGLQELLDASAARDADSKVQIEALGSQLNSALAQVAAEQRRRADLEEAERRRLEIEAAALKEETVELSRYRSEFFGKLSEVLAGREGVRVVGDRFVFSSEVLFQPASADLAPEGRSQIAGVVATLQEIAAAIPPGIDWIIRVDGHTDDVPLAGTGRYRDNWELSQGRALSVVRFMQDDLGFPPERLAATGFGEYRPVAAGDSAAARAQNRRIELKLTER